MAIKGAYWRSSEAKKFPLSTTTASEAENFPLSITTASEANNDYFTHIFYATVFIDPLNHHPSPSEDDKKLMPRFTADVKKKKSKSLLSIGEAPDSNQKAFSKMAKSTSSRATFIASSINIAAQYKFDGLDLCWKYPESDDMEYFGILLNEWHEATVRKNLLLSAVVYFTPKFDENRAYPKTIGGNVNFLNVVCYDYGKQDISKTAAHALLNNPKDPSKCTSSGILSWIKEVGADKLVMGLPLYGRTWELVSASAYEIGAPARGVGPGKDGLMEYDAIWKFNDDNHAAVVHDKDTVSTYSHVGKNWIGYDDTIIG